jgi:hypothetical protein
MRQSIQLGRTAATVFTIVALMTTSCRYVKEEKLPTTGANLEGTIKYSGEQVQFALVIVQTASGSVTGKIGDDGRYKVENVPLGEVNIAVSTAAGQGDYNTMMMASGVNKGPEGKGKGKVVGPKFIQVPEKYSSPTTSGIKTTIIKGTNTYDIDIPK